ncbi:zinc-binding dehydrogenase [Flagellimonas sp. S174]|uniref:zinc-binding dehydrogenase n=1 Tax=Flagellimonas sp. S174 TaxID=3410790 RepID=UPI003BF597D8
MLTVHLRTEEGGKIISLPGPIDDAIVKKAKNKNIEAFFILLESSDADMQRIANLLGTEVIVPHIDKVYQFGEMEKAHQHIASGRTKGKVVISLG